MYFEDDEPIAIDILNNTITLDCKCWNCGYNKKIDQVDCNICGGVGFVLNDTGEAIFKLFKRHKTRLRDILKDN